MQRLAFSTNAFKQHSLDDALISIAAAGYRAVEIMADAPHINPQALDATARRALMRRVAELNLSVSNVNAFTCFIAGDTYHPTWIEDDDSLRQLRIDHTSASIELAAELGSGTISLQPGGPLIGTTLSRREAGERFALGLQRVLPTARRHNITLGIEPEPGLFIQSASEYLEFKNQFFRDEPLVRMNCDIGHLFCVGDDPADVIRSMRSEVAHVHLEDIGKNRVHQHLAPGKGAIDFKPIFDALQATDYSGCVTVELYPYEALAEKVAADAFHFLQPFVQP